MRTIDRHRFDRGTTDGYLAGIIDGEGSIGIARKKSKRSVGGYTYNITVSVVNTDRPLIDWLLHTTGVGHVSDHMDERAGYKPAWIWSVWSREAERLLIRVLDFLVVKRSRADLALQYQAHLSSAGTRRTDNRRLLTDEACTERMKMFVTMRLLNRRGTNDDPEWMRNALHEGWLAPASMMTPPRAPSSKAT